MEPPGKNAAGTTILDVDSASSYNSTTNTGWHWHAFAADLAAGTVLFYTDDADDRLAGGTVTDDLINFGGDAEFALFALANGTQKLGAYAADLWFDTTFVDISVEANRRKFISAAGKPVDLGANGSTPTGSQPLVFSSGATASWHTNKGTGGGFTENGALTDAFTSPSD